MSKKIGELNDEQLRVWQEIRSQLWLFENVTMNPDDFTPRQALDQYFYQTRFLRDAIENFDIDETREFTISEITGIIYYLNDKEDNG